MNLPCSLPACGRRAVFRWLVARPAVFRWLVARPAVLLCDRHWTGAARSEDLMDEPAERILAAPVRLRTDVERCPEAPDGESHRWRIASHGATLPATCAHCGAERVFALPEEALGAWRRTEPAVAS